MPKPTAAPTSVPQPRYVEPTAANTAGELPLTTSHVDSWRNAGFALVDGVLPGDLVARYGEAAGRRFPEAGSAQAESITDFGSSVNFPSPVDGFDEVTLHPRLLAAVGQLLGRLPSTLRLSQSDLWPKYGRAERRAGAYDNQDQRIHIDYPNHTLAHPAPWDRPEAVEMIVYLSDSDESGGSTAVVPREGADDPVYRWPIVDSPGIGDLRYVNDRTSAETYFADRRPRLAEWRASLYARERLTRFRPGTILFYRHDTWHRGTPMRPGARRLAHNLTYRRAECEWISTLHIGWAWAAYRDDKHLERLIARASLEQRAVLGFPQPGDAYWCEATLAAVEARYGVFGFDATPYRRALDQSSA